MPDKALGMKLDLKSDLFSPVYDLTLSDRPVVTKRDALAVICCIWLPLGLFAPAVIPARIINQSFCCLKLGWDTPIPPSALQPFEKWRKNVPALARLRVRRWLGYSPDALAVTWHVFCDASQKAYRACVYMVIKDKNGGINVTLVLAKARIFPINEKSAGLHGSIPRKELVAAVCATDLMKRVQKAFSQIPSQTVYWSDSTSVIGWVRNDSLVLSPFVANRVSRIVARIEGSDMRYVPSGMNPSDHLSRGLDANEDANWAKYLDGPTWLKLPESEWPQMPSKIDVDQSETRNSVVGLSVGCSLTSPSNRNNDVMEHLIGRNYSFDMLVRRVRILLSMVDIWRKRRMDKLIDSELKQAKSSESRQAAVSYIYKWTQEKHFQDEVSWLKRGTLNGPYWRLMKRSRLRALSPFLDANGIIRVGGRINGFVDFPNPIILPLTRYYEKYMRKMPIVALWQPITRQGKEFGFCQVARPRNPW